MTDKAKEMAAEVAAAMQAKRRELIAQPLDRIWEQLAEVAVQHATARVAQLEAPLRDEPECIELLSRILRWAEQRCPCEGDAPKVCPLCGADVDKPADACRAVPASFPASIVDDLRRTVDRSRAALKETA